MPHWGKFKEYQGLMNSKVELLSRLQPLLTVLWIGSLWTMGYLVVPTLFRVLDDRALAGTLAGHLFTLQHYLGLTCGGLLLALVVYQTGSWWQWRAGLLLIMLAIIAVSEFWIHPWLAGLRAQGLTAGADFARLHGVSAVLYLLNSLLGLIWVLWGGRGQGN
jgi:hypothetical protein